MLSGLSLGKDLDAVKSLSVCFLLLVIETVPHLWSRHQAESRPTGSKTAKVHPATIRIMTKCRDSFLIQSIDGILQGLETPPVYNGCVLVKHLCMFLCVFFKVRIWPN